MTPQADSPDASVSTLRASDIAIRDSERQIDFATALANDLAILRPDPRDGFGKTDLWLTARKMARAGVPPPMTFQVMKTAMVHWPAGARASVSDAELAGIIHKALDNPMTEDEERETKGLTLYNAAADAETFPVGSLDASHPFVAEPILRRGMASMISGPSKGGKSIFVMALAMHITAGKSFLAFPVPRAEKVLILDAELQRVELIERMHGLSAVYELPIQGIDYYALAAGTKHYDLPTIRTQVAEKAKTLDVALILVDCLYALKPSEAEENSNDDMARLMREAQILAVESGAAVLVVHHAAKGSKADASVVDAHAGAGSVTRAVTCGILALREHEEEGCWSLHWQCRQRGHGAVVLRRDGLCFTEERNLNPAMMRGAKATRHTNPKVSRMPAEEFANRYIPPDGCLGRSTIITNAIADGLSQAAAERLLKTCRGSGYAFLHRLAVKGQEPAYSRHRPAIEPKPLSDAIRAHWNAHPDDSSLRVAEKFGCGERHARRFRPVSDMYSGQGSDKGRTRGTTSGQDMVTSGAPVGGTLVPLSGPQSEEDLFANTPIEPKDKG